MSAEVTITIDENGQSRTLSGQCYIKRHAECWLGVECECACHDDVIYKVRPEQDLSEVTDRQFNRFTGNSSLYG